MALPPLPLACACLCINRLRLFFTLNHEKSTWKLIFCNKIPQTSSLHIGDISRCVLCVLVPEKKQIVTYRFVSPVARWNEIFPQYPKADSANVTLNEKEALSSGRGRGETCGLLRELSSSTCQDLWRDQHLAEIGRDSTKLRLCVVFFFVLFSYYGWPSFAL